MSVGTTSFVGRPDAYAEEPYSEVLDSNLKFTSSGSEGDTWWATSSPSSAVYYLNGDSAKSYDAVGDDEDSCLQTIVESDCNETISFYCPPGSVHVSD